MLRPLEKKRSALTVCLLLWIISFFGCHGLTADPPPPPAQDFTISLSPATLAVDANNSTSTFTISIAGQNGFANPVSITISGFPAATKTSPSSPFNVAAGGSLTVTLSFPTTVQDGSYALTVNGTSGALTHSVKLPLTITAARDFTVGLSPTTLTAAPGSSNANFSVSISSLNGFAGSVSVSLTGLPSGTTTSPVSPFNVAPGASQTVTLSFPTTVQAGSYALTVNGTSGALTHSVNLPLTITNAQDFTIGLSQNAVTTAAGSSTASFTISISSLNGFAGSVAVSLTGLPSGTTTSPASPFNVGAGGSQTVTLLVDSSTQSGSYTVTIGGTSGALTNSTNLALTITPPPDFSMVLTPTTVTADAGSSNASFTASISSLNGFAGIVSVNLTGLPSGTTTSPPSPFNLAADGNQMVMLSIPSTAVAGNYNLTVSGTSGAITHSDPLDLSVFGPVQVTTWHYDNARTGADAFETTLTPSNVNSTSFGKLFTYPVDGFVVGHPLFLPNVSVFGQGVHNVVYAATMHDSVYAFDADSSSTTPLWMTSILNYSPVGATTVPATVKKDTGTTGWMELGIVSTPVIDPTTGTLYVVAETYENGTVVHRLHALDVSSGLEKFGGPTTITATYTINGITTTFADLYEMNRPGLLLANGHVYIGWGSNGNNAYSQGWVLSYNASTLQQEGTYTAEPGKTLASIWQKGAGLSADSEGNIYLEAAEGYYASGTNLSTSVLKLSQAGTTLTLADWFSPYNEASLGASDLDLNNAALLLPDQSGPYAHELIASGKEGTIYVLNRDNMGKFCSTCTTGDPQIVQEIPSAAKRTGSPVYWNNTVYFTGTSAPVTAYGLSDGTLVLPPFLQSLLVGGGGSAIITANGNTNGILWFIDGGGPLLAMDATTLNTIYTSNQAPNGRDTMPSLAHFATPIAADGKIFVGTQNSVVVYGLLSGSAALQQNDQFARIALHVSFPPPSQGRER